MGMLRLYADSIYQGNVARRGLENHGGFFICPRQQSDIATRYEKRHLNI